MERERPLESDSVAELRRGLRDYNRRVQALEESLDDEKRVRSAAVAANLRLQEMWRTAVLELERLRKERDTRTVDTPMPDELTDAKIAASEARTEVKVTRLEGKIDNLTALVTQQRAGQTTIIATTVGTGLAVIAALIAMLSYGATTFYNGTVLRDAVKAEVTSEMPAISPPANQRRP